MVRHALSPALRPYALTAGLLYAAIIALGLWSELFVRAALVVPGDAEATAGNIRDTAMLYRLSMAADVAMVAADVALALCLFALFRGAGEMLAAAATVFRLIQAAVIAAGLTFSAAGLGQALSGRAEPALAMIEAHAFAYDLGLVFFGISSLATAMLLARAGPRVLSALIAAAGLVYLAGSGLRILAPALTDAFAPAYLVAIVAETAMTIWLLGFAARSPKGNGG